MADINEKTSDGAFGSHRDSDATATNVEDVHHMAPGNDPEKRGSHTAAASSAPRKKSFIDVDESKLSAAFENPLARISKDKLLADVDAFCKDHGLSEFAADFRKGALVAQRPNNVDRITELSDEDREALRREHTHRWSQPFMLWWLVIMCSMAAAVQGMDETVNNGAQALYLEDLGITERVGPLASYSFALLLPFLLMTLIRPFVSPYGNAMLTLLVLG